MLKFLRIGLSALDLHINTVHTDSSAEVLHLVWHYPVQHYSPVINGPQEKDVVIWWAGGLEVRQPLQQGRLPNSQAQWAGWESCYSIAVGQLCPVWSAPKQVEAQKNEKCWARGHCGAGGSILPRRWESKHNRELVAGATEEPKPGSPGKCTATVQQTVATSGNEGNSHWM